MCSQSRGGHCGSLGRPHAVRFLTPHWFSRKRSRHSFHPPHTLIRVCRFCSVCRPLFRPPSRRSTPPTHLYFKTDAARHTKMLPTCDVPPTQRSRALRVRCACTARALRVHCACAACALRVRCVCAACALRVRCVCAACALHAHCVCNACAIMHVRRMCCRVLSLTSLTRTLFLHHTRTVLYAWQAAPHFGLPRWCWSASVELSESANSKSSRYTSWGCDE